MDSFVVRVPNLMQRKASSTQAHMQGTTTKFSASLEHFMNTLDRDIEYDLKSAMRKSKESADATSGAAAGATTGASSGVPGIPGVNSALMNTKLVLPPPLTKPQISMVPPEKSPHSSHREEEHISTSNSDDDDYETPGGAKRRRSMHRSNKSGALSPDGSSATDIPADVRERDRRIKEYGLRKRNETMDFIRRYESLREERERDRREKWENEKANKTQVLKKERQRDRRLRREQLQKEKKLREEQKNLRVEEKLISNEMQRLAENQVKLDKSLETLTVACRFLPLSVETQMQAKAQALREAHTKTFASPALVVSTEDSSMTPTSTRSYPHYLRNSPQKNGSIANLFSTNLTSCMQLIKEKPPNGGNEVTICRVEREIPSHSSHRLVVDQFLFDDYFVEESNVPVQKRLGRSVVQCATTGINSCTFAFGQTGSGKTFTTFGCQSLYPPVPLRPKKKVEVTVAAEEEEDEDSGKLSPPPPAKSEPPDEEPIPSNPKREGLIPFVCQSLFKDLESKYEDQWTVKISFFEIYQDMTRDLLSNDAEYLKNSVYEDHQCSYETVKVRGVERYSVKNYRQLWNLLRKGYHRRRWGSTDRHDASSRSHTIFTIYTTFYPIKDKPKYVLHSKTSIVDLSGSEPIGMVKKKFFQECGDVPAYITEQLEEECLAINRSLLQLEIVLKSIVQQSNKKGPEYAQKNRKNIPFRQSPLTWILGDCLCGNSKTFLLVCVSQLAENVSLSMNALRFATAAGRIQNKVTQNRIELWGTLLRQLLNDLSDHTETFYDILGLLHGSLYQSENLQRKRITLKRMRRCLTEIIRLLKQKEIEVGHESVSKVLERELTRLKKRKAVQTFRSVLVMVVLQFEDQYWEEFIDYNRVHREFVRSLPEEIASISARAESILPLLAGNSAVESPARKNHILLS